VPKIVVYLRVSTDEQAGSGLGLEAQLSACRAAADRLNLEIACTPLDDVSGDLASGHDVITMTGPLASTGKAS
jgi:DNA invertase Pin-like site-specific DNA recombinase